MAEMNLLQAVNQALVTAMKKEQSTVVFGEDVAHPSCAGNQFLEGRITA